MDDRKIEAVFGHEAGHVKRHHIFYFLLFALVSGCLVTVLGQRLEGRDRVTIQVATALAGGLMLLKWGVLFGWVSRTFERQADLFGVYTLGLAGVPCEGDCPVHRPVGQAAPGRRPMCASAAHVFSDTLNEVARLNNIPADAWSWRHGSIAERSRILQDYALHPARHDAFERSVALLKGGIWLAAIGSTLWAAWELRIWRMAGVDF
jgi:STE24 endopeptidase